MMLDIGKVYTFNTLAPAILGYEFKNVKLLNVFNYRKALQSNVDIKALADKVSRALTISNTIQPEQLKYYEFELQGGETVLIADAWIDFCNISEGSDILTLELTIRDISIASVNEIVRAIRSLGYTDLDYRVL